MDNGCSFKFLPKWDIWSIVIESCSKSARKKRKIISMQRLFPRLFLIDSPSSVFASILVEEPRNIKPRSAVKLAEFSQLHFDCVEVNKLIGIQCSRRPGYNIHYHKRTNKSIKNSTIFSGWSKFCLVTCIAILNCLREQYKNQLCHRIVESYSKKWTVHTKRELMNLSQDSIWMRSSATQQIQNKHRFSFGNSFNNTRRKSREQDYSNLSTILRNKPDPCQYHKRFIDLASSW